MAATGNAPSRYGRPGRIPGSCNVSAATLLDPQTKAFVPLADAEKKFAAQGITKDKRVVAYCGGGISAPVDLFLLPPPRLPPLPPLYRPLGQAGPAPPPAARAGPADTPPPPPPPTPHPLA